MEQSDIDAIDEMLETNQTNTITETTSRLIESDKRAIFKELVEHDIMTKDEAVRSITTLKLYRSAPEYSDIHLGRYIRWINRSVSHPTLIRGGIVIEVDMYSTGVYVVCKNARGKTFRAKIDDLIIFERMSDVEQMILSVMDYID